MNPESDILNKVASSNLITLDLEEYYPKGERIAYDLTQNLFHGLILKEKDFREFLKTNDWSQYKDKFVAIYCSADAIIPVWAYMLLQSKFQPFAAKVVLGSLQELETQIFAEAISKIDFTTFQDAKVVVKGCSKLPVPASAYLEVTNKLLPYTASIMYGEPCSTVPVYKRSNLK